MNYRRLLSKCTYHLINNKKLQHITRTKLIKVVSLSYVVLILFFCISCSQVEKTDLTFLNNEFVSIEISTPNGASWQMIKRSELNASFADASQVDFDANNWHPAIVPGTVLNSLVANGFSPEPYYGLNNKITNDSIPDISEVGRDFYHYSFRTEFDVPASYKGKEVWVKLNGINYMANIWLNGKNIGNMKGMFKADQFNITEFANVGDKNVLLVDIEPVENPGKPMTQIGENNMVTKENKNGGNGEIGKDVTMLMSIGWDFTFSDGIRDRNTGIWLPVELFATGEVLVSSPFVKTDLPLPDTTVSFLTVVSEVVNITAEKKRIEVVVEIPENTIMLRKKIDLDPYQTKEIVFSSDEFEELVVENPKLWWPFNKGEQNLYTLNMSVQDGDELSDQLSTHFGIREINSDRNTPDSSRVFYVNGSQFFVNGSNWIPEAMLRKSAKRTKAELLYTRQSGINFLRFWGGGISEDEYFFSLCDSLGIMLWHEFWMTGDTKAPIDLDTYFANVRSTVKRIRKHPSLAYYVSSNEQDDIIDIKPVLDELDGTRDYQHQSECCGVHDGSPYKYENPMQYYDNTASDRGSRIDGFCPEYGTVITPPIECLREMMDEQDIYPHNNEVWKYLDGNGFHNIPTKYMDAISRYGKPTSAEDMALKGQLVGAMAYRGVWENWNYNMLGYGDRWTSGVLFWYHNSPVKQVCGRMWTWSLEPTAALYVTQKALSPLHIQYDYLKNTVTALNRNRHAINGLKGECKVYDINSQLVWTQEVNINLKPEEVKNDIMTIEFPSDISDVHFIGLQLKKDDKVISDNFYWRSNKRYEGPWTTTGPAYDGFESLMSMPKTKVKMTTKNTSATGMEVKLENQSNRIAFFNRIKVLDSKGNLVRPVFYSDNYCSLLPQSKKVITIDIGLTDFISDDVSVVIEGVNLKQ